MDPSTHILCLPLTYSCQTTFISSSRLHWLHHHEWWWCISTQVYIYIHSNIPLWVRICIRIRDRNSQFTSFVRIHVRSSYSKKEFEFELSTWNFIHNKFRDTEIHLSSLKFGTITFIDNLSLSYRVLCWKIGWGDLRDISWWTQIHEMLA